MKYIKKTIKILIVTLVFIITVSSKCLAGQDDEPTTQGSTMEDSRTLIRHMEQ